MDTPEPFPVAVELQDCGVVQHQHPLVRLTPQPRLLGVRGVHRLEGHLVVVQEAVQALQLPLGHHRLGEAETRIARKIQRDPLQPLSAPTVAKDRTSVLRPDVF